MTSKDLITELLALPDHAAQRQFLKEHVSLLNDEVADALKGQADRYLRSNVQRSLEFSSMLYYLAELTGNSLHRAQGLIAEGNARCLGGLGEYQRAIELYDEAALLYQTADLPADQARSQAGKLYALAFLGRYDEALEIGQWASRVLEEHARWRRLAAVTLNLGMIHGRMGQDVEALALFDRAKELYGRLDERERMVPWADQNRAVILRNLGRFEASIQASQSAYERMAQTGQSVEAARAQQNLALTYFVLGRYNETLSLLDQVRDVFLADGRMRDAIMVELFTSDCLLQMRRFADVLAKCSRIRTRFSELGTYFEVAQALLNEAVAHAGLGHHDEARACFADARRIFEQEENETWVACTDLEWANLLLRQGQYEESLVVARMCADVFLAHGQPVRTAQAHLIAARALAALGRHREAHHWATQVLVVSGEYDIPSLTYQVHHLLGLLAEEQRDPQKARIEYTQAIEELERLRGRLMVEFRADFLEDKQAVYENMVDLCLSEEQPTQALQYAERAKSRALLDLLAYRLDLGLRARQPADRPMVDKLIALQRERDRLYRRWEGREEAMEEDWATAAQSRQRTRQDVLVLEQQITDLWHRLLVRNADYARDAALWQVRTEPVQPYLDAETALLEYFAVHRELVVFLVTQNQVCAQRLPGDVSRMQHLAQLFWLNLRAVPGNGPAQVSRLAENARGLLQRMYDLLIAPLGKALAPYRRLIVVPHGVLHYLPFHALHDGTSFLLQRHEVSYLPGASFARYCADARSVPSERATPNALVLGHSCAGRLPYALEEARIVAKHLGDQALLESGATMARLRDAISDCCIVHLATHGEFRPDNPLFSGLALEDGWLTTLDLFDMRLRASLVVLSACQTGRTTIAGGDELLGLMRALLYAGAASLVLSLWAVEDRSTALLMEAFYQKLSEGESKGSALRHAQLQFVEPQTAGSEDPVNPYTHPYFWSPFCLVGDAGTLPNSSITPTTHI